MPLLVVPDPTADHGDPLPGTQSCGRSCLRLSCWAGTGQCFCLSEQLVWMSQPITSRKEVSGKAVTPRLWCPAVEGQMWRPTHVHHYAANKSPLPRGCDGTLPLARGAVAPLVWRWVFVPHAVPLSHIVPSGGWQDGESLGQQASMLLGKKEFGKAECFIIFCRNMLMKVGMWRCFPVCSGMCGRSWGRNRKHLPRLLFPNFPTSQPQKIPNGECHNFPET